MKIHEGEALRNACLMSKIGISGLTKQSEIPRSTIYSFFKKERLSYKVKKIASEIFKIDIDVLFGGSYNFDTTGPSDMYKYSEIVPQVENVHLLGQTPTHLYHLGHKYRLFEVTDDSMNPTLKQGELILCELVNRSLWEGIARFYTYVILMDGCTTIKRLFLKDDCTYVCYSDNEDFYPKFTLQQNQIKEIWLVKRKIQLCEMPPKKFDINP